eukprot:TRINITY_DN38158_c0_g4_i2.p1 TRINITY_DN38158_c0_g4~~TRINITY_DN38158_c0_g4_i2.p1  ORF type:complete len:171 (-),score=27.93 TRINITY_DN38158_c0_g4_i2:293-805(-)
MWFQVCVALCFLSPACSHQALCHRFRVFCLRTDLFTFWAPMQRLGPGLSALTPRGRRAAVGVVVNAPWERYRMASTSSSSAAPGVLGLAQAKREASERGQTSFDWSGWSLTLAIATFGGAAVMGSAYHEGLWTPLLKDGESAPQAAAQYKEGAGGRGLLPDAVADAVVKR